MMELVERDPLNKELVLEIVKQNVLVLASVAEELRADGEVVLEAQDPMALEFAAEELRADREVVLEAVRQHRCA